MRKANFPLLVRLVAKGQARASSAPGRSKIGLENCALKPLAPGKSARCTAPSPAVPPSPISFYRGRSFRALFALRAVIRRERDQGIGGQGGQEKKQFDHFGGLYEGNKKTSYGARFAGTLSPLIK